MFKSDILKLKESIICKYDNMNQSKVMFKSITMNDYKHNRHIIIDIAWTDRHNMTVNQIRKMLQSKTINL